MIITEDFIEDGATNKIGISKAQFALLGVEYPPPKGWKKWILGKYISQESAEKYLACKGIPTKRINKVYYTPVKKKKKKKHRARKIVRLKKGNAEELLRIVEHTPLNKRNLEMFDWLFTQLYEGVPLTDRQKEAVESATIASTRNYPTPRENGYVYLARSHMQKGNLFVKIGYSKNPDKRVKGLQTANPN